MYELHRSTGRFNDIPDLVLMSTFDRSKDMVLIICSKKAALRMMTAERLRGHFWFPRKKVFLVQHALQGHAESEKLWEMDHQQNITLFMHQFSDYHT